MHQQIFGALLAECIDQQAAGVVQTAVHHEVLRFEKLPELLQHLGREFGRHAAQIGQLFGHPLHIGFGQRAQNLLGQFLAHGDQQDRRLAHASQLPRVAPPRSVFAVLLCHGPFPLWPFLQARADVDQLAPGDRCRPQSE